jgi:hypothetical protein
MGERETRIFKGFFEKSGVKTWCFGGQFVVQCVVNVVFWVVCLRAEKWDRLLRFFLLKRVEARAGLSSELLE